MDSNKISAILFMMAGVLFNISALVSKKPVFIAVGSLNICAGVLHLVVSKKGGNAKSE